ncbi:MAG: hypothetical protein EOP11_06275 [Proteobacteria bacterium]|nr:MAG: hypothetical protein EOP11_06275 [Pseudomonadota bacterium]
MIKKIAGALIARAQNFFFAPSDGRGLASLRIVLGAAMVIEALLVFPYLLQLYGPFGYLQADLIEAITGRAIPGLLHRAGLDPGVYSMLLTGFFCVHFSFAIAFLFGFKTRAANIGLWITQTMIINSGYYSSYGVDRYFQNFLFLLLLVPAVRVWSVDAMREGRDQTPRASWTFGLRLVQVFLLMTYADAGISKAFGSDWWTGEAIWRTLNQPEFRRFDFLWLYHVPFVPVVIGWATMFIEGFYFAGAYVKRLGTAWTLAIVGLHLGIASMMGGLTLFGGTLAAVNVAAFLIPRFAFEFKIRLVPRARRPLVSLAPLTWFERRRT